MIKIGKHFRLVSVLVLVVIFVITACTPAPAEEPAATTAPEQPAATAVPQEPAATAVPEEPTAAPTKGGPVSEEKIELVISTWGAGYVELMDKAVLPANYISLKFPVLRSQVASSMPSRGQEAGNRPNLAIDDFLTR